MQNHPSRSLEGKQLLAKSWFDNLKLSQSKYLSPENQQRSGIEEDSNKNESNLAINNRFKGILLMDQQPKASSSDQVTIRVFEHSWKQSIENFQSGAFVHKKFNQ